MELLPTWFGENRGCYHGGPQNVEGAQGVPRFGKSESTALDRWADGVGDSRVVQNLVEMGVADKKSAAA
ncbi:MAG: hypothetical protein WAO00_03350 [Chthoniobacterales bacterium]